MSQVSKFKIMQNVHVAKAYGADTQIQYKSALDLMPTVFITDTEDLQKNTDPSQIKQPKSFEHLPFDDMFITNDFSSADEVYVMDATSTTTLRRNFVSFRIKKINNNKLIVYYFYRHANTAGYVLTCVAELDLISGGFINHVKYKAETTVIHLGALAVASQYELYRILNGFTKAKLEVCYTQPSTFAFKKKIPLHARKYFDQYKMCI